MSIYGYTEKNETQLETLRTSLTGKVKPEELQIKSRMQSVPQGGTGQPVLTSDLGVRVRLCRCDVKMPTRISVEAGSGKDFTETQRKQQHKGRKTEASPKKS